VVINLYATELWRVVRERGRRKGMREGEEEREEGQGRRHAHRQRRQGGGAGGSGWVRPRVAWGGRHEGTDYYMADQWKLKNLLAYYS
jgi:hypothetical protein